MLYFLYINGFYLQMSFALGFSVLLMVIRKPDLQWPFTVLSSLGIAIRDVLAILSEFESVPCFLVYIKLIFLSFNVGKNLPAKLVGPEDFFAVVVSLKILLFQEITFYPNFLFLVSLLEDWFF